MRIVRLAALGSLLVLLGPACAPVRLATGEYTETRGPGVILWAGRTLRLADNQNFSYDYWSDDLSSNRYGTGTYQLTGAKLHLQFAVPPTAVVSVQQQPLAAPPDSLVLAFAVMGRQLSKPAPNETLPNVTIIVYNEAGQQLAGVSTNAAGRARLGLPIATRPSWLRVTSLGFIGWQQACPASSTAYQLALPADAGTPYAAGTVKEFRVLRQTDSTLVLGQGKVHTTFRRQPVRQ